MSHLFQTQNIAEYKSVLIRYSIHIVPHEFTIKQVARGVTTEDYCTNLGEQRTTKTQYRFILNKCYFFEKSKKSVDKAQQNCRNVFGPNTIGKLAEPITEETLKKIQEASREIYGEGKDVLTGFKKTDNEGLKIIHSSTGLQVCIAFRHSSKART